MTLKPRQVIDAITEYYTDHPACAGRSNHTLSETVNHKIEQSRSIAQKFLNSKHESEVIFTRNTTEGINLVANALDFNPGDVILTTDKEHNSNLVPWLKLAKSKGIKHIVIPSNPDNTFNLETYQKLLDQHKPKLVSVVHTSNLDGVTVPLKEIVKLAHDHGSLVMADAAQSASHHILDVQDLDIDFLSLSVHKLAGPTGMGILYGKTKHLEQLDQFMVGGDTVENTFYDSFTPLPSPEKFEAGLQDYAGIIGTGAALQYLSDIGIDNIHDHITGLNQIITQGIQDIKGLKIIGPSDPNQRAGIVSFYVDGIDPHLVAKILSDTHQIYVRSGRHCVHSWFNHQDIFGSTRASLYLYNTPEEAEQFVDKLTQILSVLR